MTIYFVFLKNMVMKLNMCQEAHCGTCRTRMTDGKVEYEYEPVAYISENEVLPCSALIKSDLNLTIEW